MIKASGKTCALLLVFVIACFICACSSDDGDSGTDGDEAESDNADGDSSEADGDAVENDGDIDSESIAEESEEAGDVEVESETESTEEEITEAEETPEMPLALCGMTPYSLVPRENVGHLVDQEKLVLFDMTPQVIENLVKDTGYAGEVEITYGCRAYNFRYTTQDRGVQVEATATVAVPANKIGRASCRERV